GPDSACAVRLGPVGLVHRAFHTVPGSRSETQPLVSARGVALTWDGRLDNRDELRRELGGAPPWPRHRGPGVAAPRRRGEGCSARLVGDFALALWDPGRRTLLLARDPFGTRTLYYWQDRRRVAWASELGALLSAFDVPRTLDEEYIAGFLTRGSESWRTPFRAPGALTP